MGSVIASMHSRVLESGHACDEEREYVYECVCCGPGLLASYFDIPRHLFSEPVLLCLLHEQYDEYRCMWCTSV